MGEKKFKVDWRLEGAPEDRRYESVADAERARARVRRMVPNGPKGKKQTGGRRPNRITAERVHHSRGKKWEEFLQATGFDKLSEHDQLLLMDSFANGGNEVFAKWKQREHDKWVTIERVVILDYAFGGKKIAVRMSDGTVVEQPYVDPNDAEKKRKAVRKASAIKPTHCTSCGISLPTAFRTRGECTTCKPAVTAANFFDNLNKQKVK